MAIEERSVRKRPLLEDFKLALCNLHAGMANWFNWLSDLTMRDVCLLGAQLKNTRGYTSHLLRIYNPYHMRPIILARQYLKS